MRSPRSLLVSLLTACLLAAAPAGCGLFGEPKADVDNPVHFTDDGFAFDHPGNWETQVEREDIDEVTLTTVYVQSKYGNAMVIVQQFTPAVPLNYDQLAADFMLGIEEGTPDIASVEELDGGDRPVIHRELLGAEREGRKVRYAPSVLGESVAHTVEIYFVELEARTLVIYTQVPDEDRGKAERGFDLVLDSLVET
ncbi:hypothetical protein G6O69_08230 [Pseudenhygromyxa sp. WMMC2535]|uniref:hypothetical protein n=1 Tax=Pseudenhygromyxa sp. WMMC2535 TaxID=2712867 RepID=UPI0015526ACF|nr:hypothetical protein [Pseudenhygromyxa sp. WMMC2535]NVB37818.1 hypothetical protein [Pseudenhygromyxa sp. WMMC2535]